MLTTITKERLDFITSVQPQSLYGVNNQHCQICGKWSNEYSHIIRLEPLYGLIYCRKCISTKEDEILRYVIEVYYGAVNIELAKDGFSCRMGSYLYEPYETPEFIYNYTGYVFSFPEINMPQTRRLCYSLHYIYHCAKGGLRPLDLNILGSNGEVEGGWKFCNAYHSIRVIDEELCAEIQKNGIKKVMGLSQLMEHNQHLEGFLKTLKYKIKLYDFGDYDNLETKFKECYRQNNQAMINSMEHLTLNYRLLDDYISPDVSSIIKNDSTLKCVEIEKVKITIT